MSIYNIVQPKMHERTASNQADLEDSRGKLTCLFDRLFRHHSGFETNRSWKKKFKLADEEIDKVLNVWILLIHKEYSSPCTEWQGGKRGKKGVIKGQDSENWMGHPHQEFPGLPRLGCWLLPKMFQWINWGSTVKRIVYFKWVFQFKNVESFFNRTTYYYRTHPTSFRN